MNITMSKDLWSNTVNIKISIDFKKNEVIWLESPGLCDQDALKMHALAKKIETHLREILFKIITNQEPYAIGHIHQGGIKAECCERCQSFNKNLGGRDE